jgi:hypothetical protein
MTMKHEIPEGLRLAIQKAGSERALAYVLCLERDTAERVVSLYFHLDEAENALRALARAIVFNPSDDKIVEMLTVHGIQARIFACTMKRGKQNSTELKPFVRPARAA